jgi:small subunit ribosomal protein S4e
MLNKLPIARKGTKYIALTSHDKKKSASLLAILRDILKLAKTRKEAKYILRNGSVKVDNKVRKDETFPVHVFGTISFDKINKNYRLVIENKKFALKEISAKEIEHKIVKISGKKIIAKNKIQINLEDGHNFILKDNFSVGDSAIVNTKEGKIQKIIPLKPGAEVEIISGKYSGQKGKLKSKVELTRGKEYIIKLKEKEVTLPLKALLVIE